MHENLSVWSGLKVHPFGDVLAFIAEEVWRRTKAPFFAAERARATLAVARTATPEERQQALSQLAALHDAELAESRRQAALVSQALAETAAEAYEAWCRAAMERLSLPPMGEAEADECRATAQRVHDELLRPASRRHMATRRPRPGPRRERGAHRVTPPGSSGRPLTEPDNPLASARAASSQQCLPPLREWRL